MINRYCENCHFAVADTRCPVCGSKRLRQINDDDYCFLTENSEACLGTLIDALEESGIKYTSVPYRSGLQSKLALPVSRYRLFVPFLSLESAQNIIRGRENAQTEKLRNSLLENIDKFNISPRLEKKINKKIKFDETDDIFSICEDIIRCADRIADGGTISNCLKGGHYLFFYSDDTTLTVNSVTYEILSLSVNKKHR